MQQVVGVCTRFVWTAHWAGPGTAWARLRRPARGRRSRSSFIYSRRLFPLWGDCSLWKKLEVVGRLDCKAGEMMVDVSWHDVEADRARVERLGSDAARGPLFDRIAVVRRVLERVPHACRASESPQARPLPVPAPVREPGVTMPEPGITHAGRPTTGQGYYPSRATETFRPRLCGRAAQKQQVAGDITRGPYPCRDRVLPVRRHRSVIIRTAHSPSPPAQTAGGRW